MNSLLKWLVLATMLLGSGCASLSNVQRNRAAAIAESARDKTVDCERADRCAEPSALRALGGKAMAESTPSSPRHYATIVDRGEASLAARLNLINSATRRIDLQTYIFDTDDSSTLVLDALLAAARRGVKVRVLVDQLSAFSNLNVLSALAGVHENFRLRIYNPTFGKAKLNYFDYAASVICCFRRFNQRMHNKLLVIDDVVGMVGGRNYQDDYFDWDSEYNFRDRDVIVAGPEARKMAVNFDAFWRAERSVPVERLNDVGRRLLDDGVPRLPKNDFAHPARVARMERESEDPDYIKREFVDSAIPVHKVLYVADLPQKHHREHSKKAVSTAPEVDGLIANAKKEVILQTPYLVLSDQAQAMFRKLQKEPSPPRIIVATNSLASTDNPVVYSMAFKFKRRNLRDMGFNIYEYKPFPEDAPLDYSALVPAPAGKSGDPNETRVIGGSAMGNAVRGSHGQHSRRRDGGEVDNRKLRAETRPSFLSSRPANKPVPVTRKGARMGLHAKSLVVDREIGVIGTHNFDPRSENYNTEGAVVIDDPVFAEALARSIERDIEPQNSWVVAPRPDLPVISDLDYGASRVSEALPVLDIWPWRYATDFQFKPGPDCPFPLPRQDPNFYKCYVAVGDFPEVNVGPKWLLVRMLTAFGAGLVPIL